MESPLGNTAETSDNFIVNTRRLPTRAQSPRSPPRAYGKAELRRFANAIINNKALFNLPLNSAIKLQGRIVVSLTKTNDHGLSRK